MNAWLIVLWPFLVPLALVVLFATLQFLLMVVGGISLDFDSDVDLDHDVGIDVDHDMDIDIDHGVDIDLDVDVDHDIDGGQFSLAQLLSPLGIGRVPLTVIGQALGFSWGVTGSLVTFGLFSQFGGPALWFYGASLPSALLGGWYGTKFFVRLAAPLFVVGGKAESVNDLVGRVGEITSLRVDGEYGEVCIPVNGAPNYVFVRSRGETIERGRNVKVIGYDVEAKLPIVAADKEESLKELSTSEGA